jgi:TIR domain
MQTVFVSYSHTDSDFVDRLVLDLREWEVPATYDKWLLRVGDSIIEKIATTVVDAASVMAVLSSAAVESSWVKKEPGFSIPCVCPIFMRLSRSPPVKVL